MSDIIIVHGAPGAGKSTLSRKFAQFTSGNRLIFHISSGERLRAIRTGEYTSRYSQEVNDPSAPAPLDHRLVTRVVFEDVPLNLPNSLVLIDGYPSFPEAVNPFLEAVNEGDHRLLGCLNLIISEETSMNRLAGRGARRGERITGITSEVVGKRYGEYLTYTAETIGLLKEGFPVINIDAEPNEQIVWSSFIRTIGELDL